MGDGTLSSGGDRAIQVWIGPGSAPDDVPSVQKCDDATPEEKSAALTAKQAGFDASTSARIEQMFNSVFSLVSAEIAQVQEVVGRTGGLAFSLIASNTIEARDAYSEVPAWNNATSLQLDVMAQEDGGYMWDGTWRDVTNEQILNADAAWATREAALAKDADAQTLDSFQSRLLSASKSADADEVTRCKALDGVPVTTKDHKWCRRVRTLALARGDSQSPTWILIRAAQLVKIVGPEFLEDQLEETPSIKVALTEEEKAAEEKKKRLAEEELERQKKLEEEKQRLEDAKVQLEKDLLAAQEAQGACLNNYTCSMLRLKLNSSVTLYDEQTVAEDPRCLKTSQTKGGAIFQR